MEKTFNAEDKILGRLASDVAVALMGKSSPAYDPSKVGGGVVHVFNTDKLAVTGAKMKNKMYYRHSGYIGNLKKSRLEEEMTKDSRRVLYKAVWNMLPKNRLRAVRLRNLKLHKKEK